jgi:nucleoid-associated protein YgaU
MKKRYGIIFLLALAAGSGLFAQSLENNEYYKKSLEYAALSQRAIDNGEFAQGAEYAVQSQEYAALSRKYIEEQLLAYRASSAYGAARARMNLAERNNLKTLAPSLYDEASGVFKSATDKFNARDYENSIPDSRRVVELLRDMEAVIAAARAVSGLAAAYEVKLNPAQRDCLWRIAGFDFVYGNPRLWRRLYEANKNTFPDPDNPDLIVPGQILQIPSLSGEVRSGTR